MDLLGRVTLLQDTCVLWPRDWNVGTSTAGALLGKGETILQSGFCSPNERAAGTGLHFRLQARDLPL